jgi:CPA1 family monovalent cation:H+ antiporter
LPRGFPHRDVIVFITFVVIFVTLVGQGLTLDPLLNFLHVREEEDQTQREAELRILALQSGLQRIAEIEAETNDDHVRGDLGRLRSEYLSRIDHLKNEMATESGVPQTREHLDYAEREALGAERRAIMELRDRGEIPDEAFRRIEYDLDLAESRLKIER